MIQLWPHVIQLERYRLQVDFEITQDFQIGQLRENRTQKLIHASKALDFAVAIVMRDTSSGRRQGEGNS